MNLPRANEAWYLIAFVILSGSGAALVLIAELGFRTSDSWVSTLANIGHGLQWVVVVAGVVSYVGMEGFNMLYERYVRRLDREAHEKGREEGRDEGRDEGRAQVLSLLDEDIRKDVERKLSRNADDSDIRTPPRSR